MNLKIKLNRIYSIVVLCCASICSIMAVPPDVDDESASVTPGQWHASLTDAKAYAELNDTPLLYVWGVNGCAQSDKLDNYTNTVAFAQWAAERKLVMVYIKAPDITNTTAKAFAKAGVNGSLTEYPMVAVYWPSKNSQPFNFSGRYPASSSSDGAEQLIAEIEFYVGDYVSPQTYDDWTVAEGLAANEREYEDTPAEDNIQNLFKYACGLPGLTFATTADLMNIVTNTTPNTFSVYYYISKSATAVTLDPVYVNDLAGTFKTNEVTNTLIIDGVDREKWKASVLMEDKGFIKLRAIATPD